MNAFKKALFLGFCIMVMTICKDALACSPGDYQTFFYGVVYNVKKVRGADEIRAYVYSDSTEDEGSPQDAGEFDADGQEESDTSENDENQEEPAEAVLIGSTANNPGSLRTIDARADFSLYICHLAVDNGTEVELRYLRNGTEYKLKTVTGTTVLNGRMVEVGTMPDDILGSELLLRFTGVKAGIEESTEPLFGDVNKDGKIDSIDASIILNHSLFGSEYIELYDLNNDQQIDDKDVAQIYTIMSGLSESGNGLNSAPDNPLETSPDAPGFDNESNVFDTSKENPFNKNSNNPLNSTPENPFSKKGDDPFEKNTDPPFESKTIFPSSNKNNVFPENKIDFGQSK